MSATLHERAVIAVYPNHATAEDAVHALHQAGISPQQISTVGKDGQAREALQGNWTLPRSEEKGLVHRGEREGFLIGGLFGLLEGCGVFLVPGLGPLVVLGPLVGFLAGGALGLVWGMVNGELTFADESADYRSRLIADDFLVVVITTPAEEPVVRHKLSETHLLDMKSLPMDQ